MINWENQTKNLCVICCKPVVQSSFFSCKQCGLACQTNINDKKPTGKYFLIDVKSKCCNADVINMQKSTCSDDCHLKLVKELENEFGEFKKIVDIQTGIAYKVPTKRIIEEGLDYYDLKNFPKWVDE